MKLVLILFAMMVLLISCQGNFLPQKTMSLIEPQPEKQVEIPVIWFSRSSKS
jgi:hypothetical protein